MSAYGKNGHDAEPQDGAEPRKGSPRDTPGREAVYRVVGLERKNIGRPCVAQSRKVQKTRRTRLRFPIVAELLADHGIARARF